MVLVVVLYTAVSFPHVFFYLRSFLRTIVVAKRNETLRLVALGGRLREYKINRSTRFFRTDLELRVSAATKEKKRKKTHNQCLRRHVHTISNEHLSYHRKYQEWSKSQLKKSAVGSACNSLAARSHKLLKLNARTRRGEQKSNQKIPGNVIVNRCAEYTDT